MARTVPQGALAAARAAAVMAGGAATAQGGGSRSGEAGSFDAEAWRRPSDAYELRGRGGAQLQGAAASVEPGATARAVRAVPGDPNRIVGDGRTSSADDEIDGFYLRLPSLRFDRDGRLVEIAEVRARRASLRCGPEMPARQDGPSAIAPTIGGHGRRAGSVGCIARRRVGPASEGAVPAPLDRSEILGLRLRADAVPRVPGWVRRRAPCRAERGPEPPGPGHRAVRPDDPRDR